MRGMAVGLTELLGCRYLWITNIHELATLTHVWGYGFNILLYSTDGYCYLYKNTVMGAGYELG